jgi:alcohol dehydrogenase
MQQLFFVKKGQLEWREVPSPKIVACTDALVRPFAVAKCDLDDAFLFDNVSLKLKIGKALGLIDPNYKKVFGDLMKGPFPFGHECVGQVIEIGQHVTQFNIGDVVSVPFQLSCGSCKNCSKGYTATCSSYPAISTYGFGKHLEFGGAMSDVVKVPYANHMLTKLPKDVDPITLASLSDNIPDAFRHIESLRSNPNQNVLIVSGKAKSVAMYGLIMAKAVGVNRVDFVDNNRERIKLAEELGASRVYNSYSQIDKKYDLVIDASSTQNGLNTAFKSVRNCGTVSSSGIYIRKTAISLIDLYAKGVNFKIGLTNAKTEIKKILELVDEYKIDFGQVTTNLSNWEDAIDAFLTDTTKLVVARNLLST